MRRPLIALALLAVALPRDAVALFGQQDARTRQCMTTLTRALPANVSDAMKHIDGPRRRLLALRSYLRNRDALADKWSWSAEQIARYQASSEARLVQLELANITRRFEVSNPGHTLYVNSQVRSLDAQISKWNENESVGAAAKALQKAAARSAPRDGCSSPESAETFRQFLGGWHAPRAPTLAAPGLSKHGQARAFDFQVKRGDAIVAGTESSRSISAWDKAGWTERLRNAVTGASGKFKGPLKMPYEPWHYEYEP